MTNKCQSEMPRILQQHDHQLICLQHRAVDAVHGSDFPIYIDVLQVRNQTVQKWTVQRSSPILFWHFRGVIGSGSLSTTLPGHTIRYIKRFGYVKRRLIQLILNRFVLSLLLLLLLYNIYIAHYITITLSASHYKTIKII